MTHDQIYQNIAQRTGGDIYIGVVGPVRSGKSSFIKRFAELMLLPRIKNEAQRARASDLATANHLTIPEGQSAQELTADATCLLIPAAL